MKIIKNSISLSFLLLLMMSVIISNNAFANNYKIEIETEPRDELRYTKKEVKEYLDMMYKRHKDKYPPEIEYTKEEEIIVQNKIEKLNKLKNTYGESIKYDYSTFLTKREKLIRLDILRRLYPIDWVVDMFDIIEFSKNDYCNGSGFYRYDFRCLNSKALHKMSEEQIISLFVHYDSNIFDLLKYQEEPFRVHKSIISVVTSRVHGYITHTRVDKDNNFVNYSKELLTLIELEDLIKSRIILSGYIDNLQNSAMWQVKRYKLNK